VTAQGMPSWPAASSEARVGSLAPGLSLKGGLEVDRAAGRWYDGVMAPDGDTKPISSDLLVLHEEKTNSSRLSHSYAQVELSKKDQDLVKLYSRDSRATSTTRAYAFDWARFDEWCIEQGYNSFGASVEKVAAYLANMAAEGCGVSSIERAYTGISYTLRKSDPETWLERSRPLEIKKILQNIRKDHGRPVTKKRALTDLEVRKMVESMCGDTLLSVRNRAILLVGFTGAFRRSELVGLNVEDVQFVPEGAVLAVTRSKTDQDGEGQDVGISIQEEESVCPVAALHAWMERASIASGPIFRPVFGEHVSNRRLSGGSVARIVKESAARIGLEAEDFSGHSLRAGLATTAAKRGAQLHDIMRQTRHESEKVAMGYIRHGSLFSNNVSKLLFKNMDPT
jgi:integrase